jgi:hypothetical protein
MEARRVTRGMNGVFKRKRPETEDSDTEIMDSDNVECLGNNNKSATPLGEIATLIAALKEVIEQQSSTIKNIQNDLAEVKEQNGQLQSEIRSVRA